MDAMASDELHQDRRRKSGREELGDTVQDQLRAKEQEISELNEEIRILRGDIKEKEGEIKKKEEELKETEKNAIASGPELRETFEQKLQFLRQGINSLRQATLNRDQQIISLRQEISSLQQAINSVWSVQASAGASQGHRRHKTAYTDDIPVEEVSDTTLWKYEVEEKGVPCTTGPVDILLDPERALVADLRYLHLLHISRNISVEDIVGMKRERSREQHDLEQFYYDHALAIMKASAEGQPEINVVAEDHTAGDGALGDFLVYVCNEEYPSEMKAVNGSSNASTDKTGISRNKAAFGKLHKIVRSNLLKTGAGGTFLCTFLNRIECIWFAKFEYDSKDRLISCQVAPEIPAKDLKPSAQICPHLDSILEHHPRDKNVMLADLLDLKAPFGFRCLTRYMDTLCRMNNVPIILVAFMTKDGTYLDMEQARIVARGMKSLIIQVGEEDVVC